MTNITFEKTKYATYIKYNGKKINLEVDNCICVKEIFKNEKNTYEIHIKIPDDVNDLIVDIDKSCKDYTNNNYIKSILYDKILILKIPYRYRKFECSFYDINNHLLTSEDIKIGDNLKINIDCMNMWSLNNYSGLTWRTNMIKKMSI